MEPLFVYVGTYTTENSKGNRNAHGKGIYVFRIDEKTGKWDLVQVAETLNPAVLQWGKEQKAIYCVNSNSGEVTAWSRNPQSGELSHLNSAMTDGNNIMIMSVDAAGEWMITADHKGIVNVFRILPDGKIGEKTDSLTLPGEVGPLNDKVQPWSRPHHTPFSPDGRFVIIPDKGLDIVHSYKIDREKGKLELVQQLKCHGASCPRHAWWHPDGDKIYINTEYTSTIIACHYNKEEGTIKPFQVVSALPDDYFDVNTMTSELVVSPNGKNVYISNRRVNNIGAFSVEKDSGRLSPVGWVDCGGKKPRFFAIEPGGKYLFNGNQSSDTITLFEIDESTGALKDTGKILDTPTPVWMLFTGSVPSVAGFGNRTKEV